MWAECSPRKSKGMVAVDYVKVLEELISIDTSVPPGLNYEKVMDYLEPLFSQAGCETQKVHIPKEHCDGNEGRVNLLAHRRNPGRPRLIFYAHVDVVPAAGWPAFTPRVADGKIYGRGTADKGAIPALLLAPEAVRQIMKYDVSIMRTTDEEVGRTRYATGPFPHPLEGALSTASIPTSVVSQRWAYPPEIRVKAGRYIRAVTPGQTRWKRLR